MSRLLLLFLIISLLLLPPSEPVQAHPAAATADEIRAAIDTRLAQAWTAIQAKENQYYAANGRYWQGLRTHTIYPADGNLVIPDIGTRTPTDQLNAWPSTLISSELPMALQLDVYDGPSGQGYVATVTVTIAGRIWRRAAQVGPETWRQQPWIEISISP